MAVLFACKSSLFGAMYLLIEVSSPHFDCVCGEGGILIQFGSQHTPAMNGINDLWI